jgi:putative ABC transport system permease protein
VAVTVIAAVVPAVQAARVTPLDALRPSMQPARRLWHRLRWLLVAEAVVAATALVVYPVDRGNASLGGVVVAVAMLCGGALLAAFLLRPIGGLVGRPFEWVFGAGGRLGRANLARDRARAGLTVGALTVGLATIVTLGSVADSARAAGQRWVDSILPGGHAIRSGIPLDIELYRPTMQGTSGTLYASPIVNLPATTTRAGARVGVELAGIDPDVFEQAGSLIFTDGGRAAAFEALREGGAVLVPEAMARRDGWERGDLIQLDTPQGTRAYEVAGVVAYSLPGRYGEGEMLVSLDDARSVFGATAASLWAMVPQEGAERSYLPAVQRTAASLAAEAITSRQLAAELSRSLDQLIGLFDVLALIAIVVAALGIVNTLTVGVYERVREIGILRAHGMTAGQVRSMVVVEAAIMGAASGVLAALVGLAIAWFVVGVGANRDFTAGVAVPLPLILVVALVGTLVSAIGGIYPARLASRLPIVRAVQYE